MSLFSGTLTTATAATATTTQTVTVRVEFVEPLGHEVIIHGRVGDDLLVAKVDPHRSPEVGAAFTLALETGAAHLFDAASERRI